SKEYYVIGLVGKRGEDAFEDLIDVEGIYE
ncbi:MAG: hypothetical protein H6P96_224, partial [Candidatus Aminicenantes bacterium]|nr:hypothetical protein [Candidatus Aminicenantes bacterium]